MHGIQGSRDTSSRQFNCILSRSGDASRFTVLPAYLHSVPGAREPGLRVRPAESARSVEAAHLEASGEALRGGGGRASEFLPGFVYQMS